MVKGAFLEPGEITTWFIFLATHSATIDLATGILEYFTKFIFQSQTSQVLKTGEVFNSNVDNVNLNLFQVLS
jgi:hypothetical protein